MNAENKVVNGFFFLPPALSAWISVLKTFGALGRHAFQRRRA